MKSDPITSAVDQIARRESKKQIITETFQHATDGSASRSPDGEVACTSWLTVSTRCRCAANHQCVADQLIGRTCRSGTWKPAVVRRTRSVSTRTAVESGSAPHAMHGEFLQTSGSASGESQPDDSACPWQANLEEFAGAINQTLSRTQHELRRSSVEGNHDGGGGLHRSLRIP